MDKKFCVYETYKIEYPQHNYIGKSSVDRVSVSGYKGSGSHFKNALEKYGKDAFEIRILAEFDRENEAYEAEEKLIEEMNPYYNIAAGGKGASSGEKNPFFGKGHLIRGEKNPMYGKTGALKGITGELHPRWGAKDSEETRRKKSARHRGEKNYWYGKGHLMRGENNPVFGLKRPDLIERNKKNSHHTLEEVKEAIIKTGSFTQAGQLLNYKNGHVGLSKRLKREGLQPIYDGSPYSNKSKIIGFEKLTKQHRDLLVPKINPTRRPTNIEIEELKKCILKHGKVKAAAKELGCGETTVRRMLRKNNLKVVYNMSLIRGRNNHKIIGFEDLY